jgi:hypothetical protein
MRSGSVHSAEHHCAAIIESVSIAALTSCKLRRTCTGERYVSIIYFNYWFSAISLY